MEESTNLTTRSFLSTSYTILKSSLPISIATASFYIKDTVSLHYAGKDKDNLAALGFAFSMMDAFGLAFVFGFIGGYGTINSQAYGAKNYKEMASLL